MKTIIHYMPINSPIFNGELIKLINDNIRGDHSHLFVMSDKETYDKLSGVYDNLKHVPKITLGMVNDSSSYDTVIMHSMFLNDCEILRLKNCVIKKMIWCIWGHDLYRKIIWRGKRNIIKNLLYRCVAKLFVRFKLRKLKAVAASFQGDFAKINEICDYSVPILQVPYTSGFYKSDIERLRVDDIPDKRPIKIMIGHSGYHFLQHKKYLDMLSKYKNENIKIVLPLAYGIKGYIKDVTNYALSIYEKDKLDIISELMPSDKYISFASTVDIAIFDYDHQAALGNIFLLSYLNKKIYLSEKGIIYKELVKNDIKVHKCSQIPLCSLDEFSHNEGRNDEKYFDVFYDKHLVLSAWDHLFDL